MTDLPGVVRVRATDNNDGDNDIPFAHIPSSVKVAMGSDATSDEVMAVFDAYDEAIDADDVVLVEVSLAGRKSATLSSGEDVHVTREAVDDLVDAQRNDDIIRYRREAYPVLPSVDIELARGGFDEVVAAADRYRDVDSLELVTVSADGFVLIRDEVNEDLLITSARERLVRRVSSSFHVTGAVVAGRGPLKLTVAPADTKAVLKFTARNPEAETVGRVVVPGARTGDSAR